MDQFWSLLKESVITQSILTLLLWGIIGYMYLTGMTVPDPLLLAGTTVLGFWFGSKVQFKNVNG